MNLPLHAAPRLRFREPGLPRLDPGVERYRLAGLGGLILQKTGSWTPLIYLMVGAATISALCWLYLDPRNPGRMQEHNPERLRAQVNAEGASL